MPVNKNALMRYRIIDECLRMGGNWTWKDLAEAIFDRLRYQEDIIRPPSRRTIFYDIQHLQDGVMGRPAPIVFDHSRQSYVYTDKEFSIFHLPISDNDRKELKHLAETIAQYKGFTHMKGVEAIITRLEKLIYQDDTTSSTPSILFEEVEDYKGIEHLDSLYKAIRDKDTISLTYQPYNADMFSLRVFPYLLKEYNNRWFLFAYNEKAKATHTYALDRINSFNKALAPINAPDFNYKDHLQHIIGVSLVLENEIEDVQFSVTKERANYILTKPLHTSQVYLGQGEDDRERLQISVIPNNELFSLLLSFGADLEVISPAWVRDKICSILNSALSRYN